MNERNTALRRALAEALLAIVTVVAVTTVVLSVREGIYLPRAFMLVVLMLGGNHSLLDLESR